MKLFHFYHIYADGPRSELVLKEHLQNLKKSGLLSALEEINIGVVGNIENRIKIIENISEFLISENCRFSLVAESDFGFEQITQKELYIHAKKNDGYYLYAHTKGSTRDLKLFECWFKSMEFFNVLNWKRAVNFLAGVDAVGCHFITQEKFPNIGHWRSVFPNTNSFFAGTFWWSKSEVIRQLGMPSEKNRFMAEQWIGNKQDLKVHDFSPGFPNFRNFHCEKGKIKCVCRIKFILRRFKNIVFGLSIILALYLLLVY
jgi:hypothetical protein